jgi:hypothetical protein
MKYQHELSITLIVGDSLVIGKVTVSNPMLHATAGFVHPLKSWVTVLKTKSVVLRLARTANVMTEQMKNMT